MNFYHIQPLITHIKLVIRGDFVDKETKAEIGKRLRAKRESAGYTREQLSELCSLSPRFWQMSSWAILRSVWTRL